MEGLERMRFEIRTYGEEIESAVVERVEELMKENERLRELINRSCSKCTIMGNCNTKKRREEKISTGEEEIEFWRGFMEFCKKVEKRS